jgi:RNA polymerase sigma factor (sigma-70 family)
MAANSAHLSVVDVAPLADDESEPSGEAAAGRSFDVDRDFVGLYETHYPRLVRALELSGASRANAEDVAQEALARTLSHWPRVKRGTNPAGYAYRVAFRLLRRVRPENPTVIADPMVPDFADEVAMSLQIERAIQQMPPAQRRCAVLCLVVGESTKDAARALRIAESTVRKQIERAREDLRKVLGAGERDAS